MRQRYRSKRLYDLSLVFTVGILLLPLWIALVGIVVAGIIVTSGLPVFHCSRRPGRGGEPFPMVKFRTMTIGSHPRVTMFGSFLRASHLDELPQVMAIVRGDMSLVGPRPLMQEIADDGLERVPGFGQRFRVLPGLTGLSQVRAGYHVSPRDRHRYDALYIANMGPCLDTWILWETAKLYLNPRNLLRKGS